jgi:hypothetical protein
MFLNPILEQIENIAKSGKKARNKSQEGKRPERQNQLPTNTLTAQERAARSASRCFSGSTA